MSATLTSHSGSARVAAASRKHHHHRVGYFGHFFIRFFIGIMVVMILFASPITAAPTLQTMSDLVAAANATAHHFIARFLGIPATHNQPELSLASCATGNSSTLTNGGGNSNSSVAQCTAHWASTSATSGIWSHVQTPAMVVEGSGSLNRNCDLGISAWIRAANLSALSDVEIESAIARLFKVSSATATKQMASILSPVHVDLCSRLARPHAFVHQSCRSLANPPMSCPRVVPAPSHGFRFPVCFAHEEPVFVAAQEMLLAQHQVASCVAGSVAVILLVFVSTAVIARRKVAAYAAHANAILMRMDLAVGIAGKQVTAVNQSLASVRKDLDDALAQRDVARIECDAAVATLGLVIAERDTAIAQRDVISSQRGTVVAERDPAIIQLESLAMQLAAVEAQRDAATAERDATVNLLSAAQAANLTLKAVLAKVLAFAVFAVFVARCALVMRRRAEAAIVVAVKQVKDALEEADLARQGERNAVKAAAVSDVRARVAQDQKAAAQQQAQEARNAQVDAESLVVAANDRVATVQVQLAATQADLAATKAQLVEACADLASAESDRDNAHAQLATARIDLATTQTHLFTAHAQVMAARADEASARAIAFKIAEDLEHCNKAYVTAAKGAKEQEALLLELHQVLKVSPGFCRLCTDFKCKQPNNLGHLWVQLENGCEAFASLIRNAHGRGLPTSRLPLALARHSGHERKQPAHQQNHQQNQQQQRGQQQQPQYHGRQQPQPHPHSNSHSHSHSHSHPYSHPHPYSQPQPQLHQQPQVFFAPLPVHTPVPNQHPPPPPHAPRVRFPELRPGLDSAMDLADGCP